MRTLNDEFRDLRPRRTQVAPAAALREFLAGKFRRSKKPLSEETMEQRLLALKDLSDGTMSMREKRYMQ